MVGLLRELLRKRTLQYWDVGDPDLPGKEDQASVQEYIRIGICPSVGPAAKPPAGAPNGPQRDTHGTRDRIPRIGVGTMEQNDRDNMSTTIEWQPPARPPGDSEEWNRSDNWKRVRKGRGRWWRLHFSAGKEPWTAWNHCVTEVSSRYTQLGLRFARVRIYHLSAIADKPRDAFVQ